MEINEAVREVRRLALEKNFPLSKESLSFLLERIGVEFGEALDAFHSYDMENLSEELIDVLIQTLQALSVLGCDVEQEFKCKMMKNYGRGRNEDQS